MPHVDATVAAPPEIVWRALRDPDLIRRWHGWDGAGLDDEIRALYLDGAVEHADEQVLVLSSGDRISFRASGSGTTVRLTRAPRESATTAEERSDDVPDDWWAFLHQLRFALECHNLAERRTVVLEGRPDEQALEALVQDAGGEVLARFGSQVAVVLPDAGPGLLVAGRVALLTTYGLDDEGLARTVSDIAGRLNLRPRRG